MRFDFQVSLLELKKATPAVQSAEMSIQVTTKTGSARGGAYGRVGNRSQTDLRSLIASVKSDD
jgi:hypothetical protein